MEEFASTSAGDHFSPQQIKKAAQALSERYRKGETPYLRALEDRHAYLVTRLPATQAALRPVFQELQGSQISSYLDIGAGPGTSWEVAVEVFPGIEQATFVELDREFIKLGKERLEGKPITWINESAVNLDVKPHDIVLFSYSWGEIKNLSVLIKAWALCRQFIVIVEPGTPQGYAAMLEARDELIKKGGHVMAPCPHSHKCPWQGSLEWCHFGVRLQRSQEHQWVKEGSRGFEDEKFSYTILSKKSVRPPFGRMVKDSLRRKGHTILTLCTENGIELKTISKKQKEYKSNNKLKWGDKVIDNI
ncbi:MAG: small ribosomal subunit Rsm22 family protein [Rhabdochlamydiaceae bacterium]